ncbi:MAG TPA: hypothetical protein VFT51_07800 [Bacillales bacterium]|nr:hypothetical protein [Bacillales bacterium]
MMKKLLVLVVAVLVSAGLTHFGSAQVDQSAQGLGDTPTYDMQPGDGAIPD